MPTPFTRASRPGRLAALAALIIGGLALIAAAGAQSPAPQQRLALIAAVDGVIGPSTERFVADAVDEAAARGAEILVLELDTPGGLVTSTRGIIEEILASPTPVIGYVSPAGGHAASAGAYILYATHVAAMAPGTNVGAATPVQIGGLPSLPIPQPEEPAPSDPATPTEDEPVSADAPETDADSVRAEPAPPPPGDAMEAKSQNDAVAYIRSLAELRGRNVEWAERAVRGAAAATANEALELGVVEILADDRASLFEQLDGRTVTVAGVERTLNTTGLVSERLEPSGLTRFLGIIANPNVAFILMIIGVYGLIFEFAQPGTIGPGVIGAISLVLALYALNQLPLNYAGLALVLLGLAFMIGEAITPSIGVLGFGGLVAFLIGAGILFDTDVPEYRLSWAVIWGTAAVSGAFLILVLGFVWRSFRRPIATGMENLVGGAARVIDWSNGAGHVWAEGERWSASGDVALRPGQTVRVEGVDALRLRVTAGEKPAVSGETRD